MSTRASEQAKSEAAWIAASRGSRYMNDEQIHKAAEEIAKLPGRAPEQLTNLLNDIAARAVTPAGLREAAGLIDQALPNLLTAGPRPPGQDPTQRKFLRGALAVFHGRVNAMAKKIAADKNGKAQAVELVRAIAAAKPSLRGANAGLELEEEARVGLGHAQYEEAAQAAQQTTGAAK